MFKLIIFSHASKLKEIKGKNKFEQIFEVIFLEKLKAYFFSSEKPLPADCMSTTFPIQTWSSY
jgi:hypothetical protein